MIRLVLPILLLPFPAMAHPGHLAGLAGHDHVIAGIAIGIAIAIGLAAGLRGKGRAEAEDDAEDGKEETA